MVERARDPTMYTATDAWIIPDIFLIFSRLPSARCSNCFSYFVWLELSILKRHLICVWWSWNLIVSSKQGGRAIFDNCDRSWKRAQFNDESIKLKRRLLCQHWNYDFSLSLYIYKIKWEASVCFRAKLENFSIRARRDVIIEWLNTLMRLCINLNYFIDIA